MQLKITGKNSDGEYWLHLVGGGQNAGFNLGDPATMVGSALLKAASGQRFVSAENPPCMPIPAPDVTADLVAALTLAANRLHYCAIEKETGSQRFIELCEWTDEARAAITAYKDAQK